MPLPRGDVLRQQYDQLVEQASGGRRFSSARELSRAARAVADAFARRGSSAAELIGVHASVVAERLGHAAGREPNESHYLLLEVLGHLTEQYRRLALEPRVETAEAARGGGGETQSP